MFFSLRSPNPLNLRLSAVVLIIGTATGMAGDLRDDVFPVHELPPVRITATRGPQAMEFPHLGIRAPLEPFAPRFADTFAPLPGLIVQESFGGIDPPRLSLRGSGLQSAPVSRGVGLSFNGFPLNFADGSFNLSLIETTWIEEAGLISGTAAGMPHLGGSLSFWSGSSFFNGQKSATAALGSNRHALVSTQGSLLTDSLQPAWGAAALRTDGWRNYSKQERDSLLAAIRTPTGERSDMVAQFYATRPEFEVPGPLTKSDALSRPRSNNPAVMRDRPRRDSELLHLAARHTTRGEEGHVSFGLSGTSYKDDFRQLLPNGITTSTIRELAVFGDARRQWDTVLEQETEMTMVAQGGEWDVRRYRTAGGAKGDAIGNNRLHPRNLTLAVDHRVAASENQTLEVGASLISARRQIGEKFETDDRPSTAFNSSSTKAAPRVSWAWTPLEEATLVFSWSRSHEPPTYDDLFFTEGPMTARQLRSRPLAWQTADTYEAAIHHQHNGVFWSFGVYYAPWKNELLRLVDADGAPRGTVNADRTLHTGTETSLFWPIVQEGDMEWVLQGTWQYSVARFQDDPVYGNRRLAGIPPHSGRVVLRGAFPDGWFLHPGLHWQAGKTFADHANLLSHGGFSVWSVDMGRRFGNGWTATVSILNLFDRKYISSTAGVLDRAAQPETTTVFLPGTGRRIEVRIDYLW